MLSVKCVYIIRSKKRPELFYIGSTKNFSVRRGKHKHNLNKGISSHFLLQQHVNKYGFNDFVFSILEEVGNDINPRDVEQKYIDQLKPTLNICKSAKNSLGVKARPSTRDKISFAMKKLNRTGDRCPVSKKIIDKETGKVYSNLRVAAKETGVNYSTLSKYILGLRTNKTNLIAFK